MKNLNEYNMRIIDRCKMRICDESCDGMYAW